MIIQEQGASAEDVAAAETARQAMEKEIAAMAAVTGNSSFTEKKGDAGVPARPRRRAEDHLLGGGQEHGVHRGGPLRRKNILCLHGQRAGERPHGGGGIRGAHGGSQAVHPGAATRGRCQGVPEQNGPSVWPDQQDIPRAVRSREVCPEGENDHPGSHRVGRRSRHGTGRDLHGSGPDAGRHGGRRRKCGSAQRGASAQWQTLHAQPL